VSVSNYSTRSVPFEFPLEVGLGNVPGYSSINKFGRAPAGLQTTATDVWDRADATPTQQIWVAPTQARTHDIVSTSTSDDGDPAGVGARTVKIYGLTGWGAAEVNETITLNGTTNVPTANAYVIIHRMKVLTKGATNVNVGTISATAQTDSSVTAIIRPGLGQTEMAIYGVPSTQKLCIALIYASILKSGGAAASADMGLEVNPEPDAELTNFITKHTFAAVKDGSSAVEHRFGVPKVVEGPAIIKIQGLASAADLDVSAGFDAYLVNN